MCFHSLFFTLVRVNLTATVSPFSSYRNRWGYHSQLILCVLGSQHYVYVFRLDSQKTMAEDWCLSIISARFRHIYLEEGVSRLHAQESTATHFQERRPPIC